MKEKLDNAMRQIFSSSLLCYIRIIRLHLLERKSIKYYELVQKIRKIIWTICVIALCCTNCTALYPQSAHYPRKQPVEIYVDSHFTDTEKQEIQNACDAWTKASGGTVRFLIYWDMPKPGRFHQMIRPKSNQGIFFWQIEYSNDNDLTEEMRPEFWQYHGLFVPGPGHNAANLLVLTDLAGREHFYQVAAHEIGHLLGLEHIPNHKDAIMFPHATGTCITKWDMQELCSIYNCVPQDTCIDLQSP